MEIGSRYKTYTTSGGDSSIQISSCDPVFACLANKWATVLALLLAICYMSRFSVLTNHYFSGLRFRGFYVFELLKSITPQPN